MTTDTLLRLLLVEDNATDVELETRELLKAGMRTQHRVADTAERFMEALEEFAPDVILSDFSMPRFDGMEALRIARERAPDTPFLFVSGTLGEEYAIRALKNGASDYVLKANLIRLPSAVQRALEGAQVKRARLNAEASLARAQRIAKLAHVITGPGGGFESWSGSLPELLGAGAAIPASTREWLALIHPDDRPEFRGKSLEAAVIGKRVDIDYRLRRTDGSWADIRQVIEPLPAEQPPGGAGRWFSTLQDVTEQKRAENQVRRLVQVYAMLSGVNAQIARASRGDEMIEAVCRIAVSDGRFLLAWFGWLGPSMTRLEVVAASGNSEGYVSKMPLLVHGAPGEPAGLAGLAVQARTAVVSNDIAQDDRVSLRKEALARGFRSLAMLPLLHGTEVLGVLALYSDQVDFFDVHATRLLSGLAAEVAFALDRLP